MTTVTFCFADQAGSTVQLERLGDTGAKWARQGRGRGQRAVVAQQQAARHPDAQALGVGSASTPGNRLSTTRAAISGTDGDRDPGCVGWPTLVSDVTREE